MKRVVRYVLVGTLVYGVYLTLIWFAIRAVSHAPKFPVWPFVALAVLGAVVEGVIAWYLWRRTPAAAPQDDDIVNLFAAANGYLANAPATKGTSLRNTATVVVLGTPSSAKTTLVSRSPIEATLLAGQTRQEGTVAPPSTIVGNVWYTARALIVEAGQSVVGNAQRWSLFVRHLLPSRGLSVLLHGTQASRVAVACVSCEDLKAPDAAERLASISKSLNASLSELAVSLGVRLPVYVVFTQADLIPGFTEAAITLTQDETRQVVGATLPIVENEAVGLYGEQQTARLTKPFTQLYHAFALDRQRVLSRGADIKERAAAYEFAREFRKIIPGAVQFLVDLCRPNPLRASPFLRGFYFTGVRPVVAERASEAVLDSAPRLPVAASATMMLSGPAIAEARRQHVGSLSGGSGRRPQWVFLDRLFSEVILADEGALGLTSQGKRVDATRRGAAVAGSVLAALAIFAFIASFAANSELVERTRRAMQPTSTSVGGTNAPSTVALANLDSLRAVLLTIDPKQSHRADAGFLEGFGLYQGQKLLQPVRRAYFASFNKLLMTPTRSSIESRLAGLAGVEGQPAAFDTVYDALKAYLVTTDYPDSAAAPLSPLLLSSWPGRPAANRDALELAERQFSFYVAYLPRNRDLGTAKSNPRALAAARDFLKQYKGPERVYKLMVDDAALHVKKDFSFSATYPDAGGVLTARYVVPAAYTREGWAAMQNEIDLIRKYLSAAQWVTADSQPSPAGQAELKTLLKQKYLSDYINKWRTYLTTARIPDLGSGWQQTGDNIKRLGSRDSPLLRFLAAAARNTDVDTSVKNRFQAVHHLEPKADPDVVVNQANQAYADALTELGTATAAAGAARGGSSDPLIGAVAASATKVGNSVTQLADGFVPDPDAHIDRVVIALLNRPADIAASLVSSSGRAAEGAETFCADFAKLASKYPFDTTAAEGNFVTMKDFVGMFSPATGRLPKLIKQIGLQRRGAKYVRGTSSQISDSFLEFISKAAQVTDSLFVGGGAEPHFSIVVRPDPNMDVRGSLATDESSVTFTPHEDRPQTLQWHGLAATHATLQLHYESNAVDTRPVRWPNVPGNPWALLAIFDQATRSRQGPYDVYKFQVSAPHIAALRVDQGQEVVSKRLFQVGSCKP